MRKSALFALGLVVTMLVALGLITLVTASEAMGLKEANDAFFYVKRQFAFLGVGILAAGLMAKIDYRFWRDQWVVSAIGFLAILILLEVVLHGAAIKGSHRWIRLGIVNLQPSEFAKLITVIAMAVWLDRKSWKVGESILDGFIIPSLLLCVLVAQVLREPDYGAAGVILGVGMLVMFVAGTPLKYLLVSGGLGAAIFALLVYFNPNRKARLFDSKGYQVDMALAAIHNGGVWGVGLGESMQKQRYLPEAHTDFVLAVGAEEFGLFYSIAVVLLFVAFFALSVYIARKASDRFGRFIVVGMSFLVFFQSMFNIGVVSDALVTKGVALPFFSYGGTSMLSSFIAVGLIFSVGIHSYMDQKREFIRKVVMR